MNTLEVLKKLAESAERFVNKAPKQTRLEAERQALLDVITHAQLVLSVSKTTPHQQGKEPPTEEDRIEAGTLLRSLPGSKSMSKKQKHIVQQRSGPRRYSKTVAP